MQIAVIVQLGDTDDLVDNLKRHCDVVVVYPFNSITQLHLLYIIFSQQLQGPERGFNGGLNEGRIYRSRLYL
jgi:hypothetical protein